MKTIAHSLKSYMKRLARPFNFKKTIDTKKMASEPEKEGLKCLKQKDSKILISDKHRKLLHQFRHFHSDN